MGFKGLFNSIYYNNSQVTEADKGKGRNLFIYEGITARTVFLFTSGAYLAGFAKLLGADDSVNGIIAAVPALSGLVQILSPMVFENLGRRKFLITISCFLHRLLLSSMIFIPLLFKDMNTSLIVLCAVYFISYCFNSFATPAVSNWQVTLTNQWDRGKYFGTRDSAMFAISTIFNLIIGRVLDNFKNNSMEYEGFFLVYIVTGAFSVLNFLLMSSIKEPAVEKSEKVPALKEIFTKPLKDKGFNKIIGLFLLWNIGLQIGSPFFAVYMVTGLNLNYTYITICNTISAVLMVTSARIWGVLADKTSWSKVSMITIGILGITHSLWFFTTPANVYLLMPLNQILGGIAWGGINLALFNIQFAHSPEKGRTIYLGFNAALGGLVGFAFSMFGSLIVGLLDGHTINIASFTITKMQIVFGLSGVLLTLCAIYIKKVFKDDTETESLVRIFKNAYNGLIRRA